MYSVGRLSFIYAGEHICLRESIYMLAGEGHERVKLMNREFRGWGFPVRLSSSLSIEISSKREVQPLTGPLIGLAYMTNIAIYHMENRIRQITWEFPGRMVWCWY